MPLMHYPTYLRWGALSALFLALFVPFIIAAGNFWPNLFFPYITGKNFAFRILVECALLCYALLALREPKYRPRLSNLMWAVVAFVAWMAIATIFSVDPVKSFWSNFERMEGYITTLHLFAYFLMVGAVVTAEKWWDRLFQVSVTAGSLQALYSLGQLLHVFGLTPSSQSGARLDGTYGNATYLAVFSMYVLFGVVAAWAVLIGAGALFLSAPVVWGVILFGLARREFRYASVSSSMRVLPPVRALPGV